MPLVKTAADTAIAEVVADVLLYSENSPILPKNLQGQPLQFMIDLPPSTSPQLATMLRSFTSECFGENNKVVNPYLIQGWVNQCSAELGPSTGKNAAVDGDNLKALIIKSAQDAIGTRKSTNELLVSVGKRMRDWKCQTVAEVGEVIAFADRLTANFEGVQGDKTRITQYLQKIADASTADGKPNTSLYEACTRLNEIWLGSERSLEKVLNRTTTMTQEEATIAGRRQAAETLTEIARCASEIKNGKQPTLDNGITPVLIPYQSFSTAADAVIADVGEKFFGLPRIGKSIVDPTVIGLWAARSPKNAIGTTQGIADQGKNLVLYVDKTARQLHAVNTTDLKDVLANAYQAMEFRGCATVTEASEVVDYADQLVSKKLFKDRDSALQQFSKVMNQDPDLKGSSQYDFVTRLERLGNRPFFELTPKDLEIKDILQGKTTLGNVERSTEIGSGPEREKDHPNESANAAHQ